MSKSLLRPMASEGEPRFTLLETIREYALEQLVARGEATPAATSDVTNSALASGVRPAVPRPTLPRATALTVPHAPDADGALRARGEWRSTAVVPWTLGEGRKSPRLTEPSFKRFARVAR